MNLDAYRRRRLAEASEAAERVVAEAEAEARARLAVAARTADAVIARARDEGEADARRERSRALIRERRRARRLVLGAQRAAYERLRAEVRDRALALRLDPRYEDLLATLEELAVRQLGAEARIVRDAERGGVVAEAAGRRVDYTLPALADRALRDLGGTGRELWS